MGIVVRWSPDWMIGVACIDDQHQKLVSLLADLQQQLASKSPQASCGEALVALLEHTEVHFAE